MLPCVAVHLGEAEWKFTFAKLSRLLNLEKETSTVFLKYMYLLIIGFEIWFMVYASLKIFRNIIWSWLQPEDLTITAVRTETSKFVFFCTTGCYVEVLSNSVEKLFLNWNRDSLCS